MGTHRMKLDYNNLLSNIDDVLGAEYIETVHNNAYGIAIGLDLLSGYIRDIAQHAIDTGDEYLISMLSDLCVIKEDNDGT